MTAPYLTVAGLRLDIAGFCGSTDLTALMALAPFRGPDDFVTQGVDGATFREKFRGELRAAVGLKIFGENDKLGVAHPDPVSGCYHNLKTIESTVCTGSKSALVTATLTFPDATAPSASVYCPRIEPGRLSEDDHTYTCLYAALEIVVPSSGLT